VKDGRKGKKKTEKRRKTGETEKTKTERGERKEKESFCGHQRRECRSFAHRLVRHLWHSEQAGFAGISFSFSFLAIFQSWCLLIVLSKNLFLLLSGTYVFFCFGNKLYACSFVFSYMLSLDSLSILELCVSSSSLFFVRDCEA
jgi:hypothetical protein